MEKESAYEYELQLTTDEARIAFRYIHKKLNNPIFTISKKSDIDTIESDFQLENLPKDRRKNREFLLNVINNYSPALYFRCCSAIKCFSRLLFAQYVLNECLPKLNEQNKLPKGFQEDSKSLHGLLDMNKSIQEKNIESAYFRLILEMNNCIEEARADGFFSAQFIRSIDKKIPLVRPKLKQDIPLHPFLVEAGKRMFPNHVINEAETEFIARYHFYNIETKICHPQNLIFNSLIWIVFITFYNQQSRAAAEQSTAALINEYCFHNSLLSSMVRELTKKSVEHILYETEFLENDGENDGERVPFLQKLKKTKKKH